MKILYQGSPGAYSHLAALQIYPDAEIISCKTFDQCFEQAKKNDELRIIIPESNRTTGSIGIEYLIFKVKYCIDKSKKDLIIFVKIKIVNWIKHKT